MNFTKTDFANWVMSVLSNQGYRVEPAPNDEFAWLLYDTKPANCYPTEIEAWAGALFDFASNSTCLLEAAKEVLVHWPRATLAETVQNLDRAVKAMEP